MNKVVSEQRHGEESKGQLVSGGAQKAKGD
jgi:hypothetical protein